MEPKAGMRESENTVSIEEKNYNVRSSSRIRTAKRVEKLGGKNTFYDP